MAPPKTLVLSQQQQQQQQQQQLQQQIGQQVDQQALIAARQNKPRKRKSKQHSNIILEQQQNLAIQNDQQQQVNNNNNNINHCTGDNIKLIESAVLNGQSKENLAPTKLVTTFQPMTAVPVVVPSERTTLKKQQVPTPVKENNKVVLDNSKRVDSEISVDNPARINGKSQQLSTEEADDIDAGIELDGSSNSGSSVKDINDDQLKSTSVSPVMAQSNLVNETTCVSQQSIEMVVSEDVADVAVICSASSPAKKISTTKQQLAANQQVIDADEQLLQEKLQNKQRKSQQTTDNNFTDNDNQKQVADKLKTIQHSGQNLKIDDSNSTTSAVTTTPPPPPTTTTTANTPTTTTPFRRRFSSQASQEAQDSSLCKVCEQHVYQMERMLAEKSIYHKRCFRCHQCKIQLRVDNYSSHEGQVYCKAHHRQLFQPQVKLDSEDDVEIVAKSTSQTPDDYLLHRGRLSELSFSFLQQNSQETRKRHMIIFENEPAQLPKDVVRSDTKLDDGIEQLNLNLNNILEKFERGTAGNEEDNQPSSAGVVIDKPSFNIKKTLMAFESRLVNSNSVDENEDSKIQRVYERPVVKKLTNISGFLNRQNSIDNEAQPRAQVKPLAIRRSESLLMRLKKYESRIAGEHVDDEDSDEDENNNNNKISNNAIETQKRHMIICENEPTKLSRDIVRSGTKLDDGIEQLNLNVNNILEKFERGTTNNGEESQPTSANVVMEKPYFNIKKTLMAFESRLVKSNSGEDNNNESRVERGFERPVVKKLTNINGFLNRQNSTDSEAQPANQVKPLAVGRSESLLMRLKKYESRAAGEQVEDEYSDDDESVS